VARPLAVDPIGLWIVDLTRVAVAGNVPHDDLVALPDGPAAEFDIAMSLAPITMSLVGLAI